MAYFPNGTSGMMYQNLCENCWNWRDLDDGRGFGCPIWDLHMLWNYDQIEHSLHRIKKAKAKIVKEALEHFIPTREDGFPDQCKMFLSKNEIDIEGQAKFEFTEN